MTREEIKLFNRLVEVADQFDGNFTIMKFTTNWRVGFGTPYDQADIDIMQEGKTFAEAAGRALWEVS